MQLPNHLPKNHLFEEYDYPLFESAAIFSYCQVLIKKNMHKKIATIDLFVRDMPKNRNFMLFGGLEEIITHLKKWKFEESHVQTLLDHGVINNELANYLRKFKFTGSVDAMPEGTVFFPSEPILRITAPIIDANLIFVYLVNAVPSNTIFMSKAIRSVLAAKGKPVISNGGRAQGFEAGTKYVRSAYLTGIIPALQLSPAVKYGIKIPGKVVKSTFHAYIKAFPSELEAMLAFVDEFPNNEATLIVDTYDFKNGVANAIRACKYLQAKGGKLHSIFIDSGDLYENSTYARRQLDEAGFGEVKILVASNLNEWRIRDLIKKNAPIDSMMAITELVTSYDDPKLEIVYKMSELQHEDGTIRQTMKLSQGKKSYPGRKQIHRVKENGKFVKDIIGLEGEELSGEKLLVPIMIDGELVYQLPKLDDIKTHIKSQVDALPDKYQELEVQEDKYKIEVSPKLQTLIEKTQAEMH